MIYRRLITQFGIQPREIAQMTLPMVQSLLDTTGEVVTLRDVKQLERFFSGR